MGSFSRDQVKEIARSLAHNGFHFLWCLWQSPEYKLSSLMDTDLREALPEGFLDRMVGRGKIIGWAPHVVVLSHPAVGGFVSYCGWNSILKSLWCGVLIATLPLEWEQQPNAFQMMKELGLAVEIRFDYRAEFYSKKGPELVHAEEIEEGVRRLMVDAGNNEIRKRVKEMREKGRKAFMVNGSSYASLSHLINEII